MNITAVATAEAIRGDFYMETDDGQVSLSLSVVENGEDTRTISTTIQHPCFEDESEALFRLRRPYSVDTPEDMAIAEVGEKGEIDTFHAAPGYRAIRDELGYARTHEEVIEDGVRQVTTRFTYPLVARLNDFMDEYRPDSSTRFSEFAGGEYGAEEFVVPFTEEGKILVATEIPAELHDHAGGHVLGWLGMTDEAVRPIRESLLPYVARMHAERDLPPVPGGDDRRIKEYLTPSEQIVKDAMYRLDRISAGVGELLLAPNFSSRQKSAEGMFRELESFFEYGSGNSRRKIPDTIFGQAPHRAELLRVGIQMLNGLHALDEKLRKDYS
jgi:hypothetical protein